MLSKLRLNFVTLLKNKLKMNKAGIKVEAFMTGTFLK
jgi:hypothetical protein